MSEFNAHISGGGAIRRSSASASGASKTSSAATGPLHIDVDPPPKPWPFAPVVGLAFIVLCFFLQLYLPATHYRHPFDPHRQWISFTSELEPVSENSTKSSTRGGNPENINIFSWLDHMDIRPLAVLVNSTICNSRYPGYIHFHFFLPDNVEDQHSHYKLKALFPKANIIVHSHHVIREEVAKIVSDGEHITSNFAHTLVFYISKIYQNIGKFIYLDPNVVVKDKVEDLFQVDLENFALAAVEDCSQNLGTYKKLEVINAIQRSGARPWVAQVPYEKSTCILDLSVLLVNADNLEKENITETMKWWTKVLHADGEREDQLDQAVLLAFYGKYVRLDTAWNFHESKFSEIGSDIKIFQFDGEKKPWLKQAEGHVHTGMTNIWWGYLSPLADQLLREPTT